MFERHVSDVLAGYLDAALPPAKMERVSKHLARCERCRAELARVGFGAGLVERLPVAEAPVSVLAAIEAAASPRVPFFSGWRLAAGAAFATCVVIAVAVWFTARAPRARWDVVRVAGSPTVGASRLAGAGQIAEGQWLQTDSGSRASIKVGDIGTVEVAPNTRLRLTVAKPNEHRLTLARGEISASVTAPPRLFFVDTASSTAVDLGCSYKMNVDDAGDGLLQVTLGWVALEWDGKVSEVPAGAYCRTRRKVGPGTPYFEDASAALQTALARFDFSNGGVPAVESVMNESHRRDTLTLWHLLSRVDPAERVRVLDRLVALASLPPGITREKTLALDPATLKQWGDELVLKW